MYLALSLLLAMGTKRNETKRMVMILLTLAVTLRHFRIGVGWHGLYIPYSHEAVMILLLLGVVRASIWCWPMYEDKIKILKHEDTQCPQCNDLCQMELYKKKKQVARERGNKIKYEWVFEGVEPRVYCTSCGYDVDAEECRDIFPLEDTDIGEMEIIPLAAPESSTLAQHQTIVV